jgi:hypothetical protein
MFRSILSALVMACAVAPASASVLLDDFLGGMDAACTMTPAFDDFWKSLNRKFGVDGDATAALVVPPGIATATGAASAARKEDHVWVQVPMTGQFRTLKVKAINFALGIDNGIFVYEVVFEEPAGKVHKALDRAVAVGNRKLQKSESEGSTGIRDDRSGVSLYCDLSN